MLEGGRAIGRTTTAKILSLSRYTKRAILVANDLIVLLTAIWLAFSLRLGGFYSAADNQQTLLVLIAPFLAVVVFAQIELYKRVTRYLGVNALYKITLALAASIMLWVLVIFLTDLSSIPRSVVLIYWAFGTIGVWGTRQLAVLVLSGNWINARSIKPDDPTPVLIFGAGELGAQLTRSLMNTTNFEVAGFIDNSPNLWGQYVEGIKVYRPSRIAELVEQRSVQEILLALTDASRQERAKLIQELENLPVRVRTLPDLESIATGRVTINDLRPVGAADLLGRDPVQPNKDVLLRSVFGKTVMVTGAGGSIGAELARQVVKLGCVRIVLFDLSESALYLIDDELRTRLKTLASATGGAPEVVTILGSVLNSDLVRSTMRDWKVQTVFHAAAYKHVPMVQKNPKVSFSNNTLGTIVVADAAIDSGVERFVLISTDKAVRPTSFMGASKRLAEMALQARTADNSQRTVLTNVRFGNVLDSSGSVVRTFRSQIESGGPVTVTHKDMVRYFMSQSEAASLVIQAAGMAAGGEVFVLDMGEPVRIDDLARSMIRLMGLQLRDNENPKGDIAISYVGLRPGEKLFEELLIGANATGTEHPRICRCEEPFLPLKLLDANIAELFALLEADKIKEVHEHLYSLVDGYKYSVTGDVDGGGWPTKNGLESYGEADLARGSKRQLH